MPFVIATSSSLFSQLGVTPGSPATRTRDGIDRKLVWESCRPGQLWEAGKSCPLLLSLCFWMASGDVFGLGMQLSEAEKEERKEEDTCWTEWVRIWASEGKKFRVGNYARIEPPEVKAGVGRCAGRKWRCLLIRKREEQGREEKELKRGDGRRRQRKGEKRKKGGKEKEKKGEEDEMKGRAGKRKKRSRKVDKRRKKKEEWWRRGRNP